ncbi:MAG: hypothetical protein CMD16_04600 [Flavobacteriales bacterium]|mgnify:CR=1 FL=1|nr:hypothetical protein [Flavobacteriales bacterium]
MKKLLLFVSPLIFLVACSSGGDSDPQPTVKSAEGVWEADSYIVNLGDTLTLNALDSIDQAYYYCWGDTLWVLETWELDGSKTLSLGSMSYNDDQTMINMQEEAERELDPQGNIVYENFEISNFGYEITKFTNTEIDLALYATGGSEIIEFAKTSLTLPSIATFKPTSID